MSTTAAKLQALTADSYAHPSVDCPTQPRRVTIIAASLVDLYGGRRFALQTTRPEEGERTIAFTASAEAAARFVDYDGPTYKALTYAMLEDPETAPASGYRIR